MSVSFRNENSTIVVTHPGSDHLVVDSQLNRIAHEIMTQTVMREIRNSGILARRFQGLLGRFNLDDSGIRIRKFGFRIRFRTLGIFGIPRAFDWPIFDLEF